MKQLLAVLVLLPLAGCIDGGPAATSADDQVTYHFYHTADGPWGFSAKIEFADGGSCERTSQLGEAFQDGHAVWWSAADEPVERLGVHLPGQFWRGQVGAQELGAEGSFVAVSDRALTFTAENTLEIGYWAAPGEGDGSLQLTLTCTPPTAIQWNRIGDVVIFDERGPNAIASAYAFEYLAFTELSVVAGGSAQWTTEYPSYYAMTSALWDNDDDRLREGQVTLSAPDGSKQWDLSQVNRDFGVIPPGDVQLEMDFVHVGYMGYVEGAVIEVVPVDSVQDAMPAAQRP